VAYYVSVSLSAIVLASLGRTVVQDAKLFRESNGAKRHKLLKSDKSSLQQS
jgi:hypothetical protein